MLRRRVEASLPYGEPPAGPATVPAAGWPWSPRRSPATVVRVWTAQDGPPESEATMTTLMVFHEVDDVDHWLRSPVREEVFGPLGMTARTFVDPAHSNKVGLVVEVPDVEHLHEVHADGGGRRGDAAGRRAARHGDDARRVGGARLPCSTRSAAAGLSAYVAGSSCAGASDQADHAVGAQPDGPLHRGLQLGWRLVDQDDDRARRRRSGRTPRARSGRTCPRPGSAHGRRRPSPHALPSVRGTPGIADVCRVPVSPMSPVSQDTGSSLTP